MNSRFSRISLLWTTLWAIISCLHGVDSFALVPRSLSLSSPLSSSPSPSREYDSVLRIKNSDEPIFRFEHPSGGDDVDDDPMPLCDLQTLLRLTNSLSTGGSAKVAIQSGDCQLNGGVETRRAKKLFPGDVVAFKGKEYIVEQVVRDTNYQYKPKVKKIKPKAQEDAFGNKEFGGRYRSEDWRKERKQKKADRKTENAATKNTISEIE